MRKIPKCRDIIQLAAMGYSDKKISEITGSTRRTVKKIRSAITEKKLEWPLDIHMDDTYLYYTLFPSKEYKRRKKVPEVDAAYDEMISGKSKRQLFQIYMLDCNENKEEHLQYDQFRRHIHNKELENKATSKKDVIPGKQAYVLWLKEPVTYTDLDGVAYKGKIFLGILPYSQYVYAGLYQEDTKNTWIDAHIQMFSHFGGAPHELIVEKSKSSCFRGELQMGYRELAEYYSTYIILNEKNEYPEEVKEIVSWFALEAGDEIFPSYVKAAAYVKDVLERYLTECPHGKKNRAEMFSDGEQKSLLKHPDEKYTPAIRKNVKVLFNSHIKYEGNYYSVPFRFTMLPDKEVQMEVSRKSIKFFHEGKIIAEHPRIPKGKGIYQTHLRDMPSAEEARYMEWHPDRFLTWAGKIGPNTKRVIKQVLGSKDIVQRAYIHCRTILQYSKTYGEPELEKACEEVLANGRTIVYTNIENAIKCNLHTGMK